MASTLSEYPPKVLLAWGEAISGNSKIRDWLIQNGFQELGMFCFALRNSDEARAWLIKAAPHLMALINAGEGNVDAYKWLSAHGYMDLYHMALAIDNNEEGEAWVMRHMSKLEVLITQKMQFVKNRIDAENNDPHRFNNS